MKEGGRLGDRGWGARAGGAGCDNHKHAKRRTLEREGEGGGCWLAGDAKEARRKVGLEDGEEEETVTTGSKGATQNEAAAETTQSAAAPPADGTVQNTPFLMSLPSSGL